MATDAMGSFDNSIELLRHLSRTSSGDGVDMIPFSDELELLQNVYFNELEIVEETTPAMLKFTVRPSTGEEKDKQFVYVETTVAVDAKYPASKPNITIDQSRGLSDAHLQSIIDGVHHLALEHIGSPMIYDLIEYIRDCLTDNNRPCGKCALCQFEFQEDDEFLRTQCYHYFHPQCLTDYIHMYHLNNDDEEPICSTKQPKQLVCPVCRVAIDVRDTSCLNLQPSPHHSKDSSNMHFTPDPSLLLWQRDMAVLYQKQVAKGGIIDSSGSDTSVDWTWVSSRSSKEETETEGNRDKKDESQDDDDDRTTNECHKEDSHCRPHPKSFPPSNYHRPRPPNNYCRPRPPNHYHQYKDTSNQPRWQGDKGHSRRNDSDNLSERYDRKRNQKYRTKEPLETKDHEITRTILRRTEPAVLQRVEPTNMSTPPDATKSETSLSTQSSDHHRERRKNIVIQAPRHYKKTGSSTETSKQ